MRRTPTVQLNTRINPAIYMRLHRELDAMEARGERVNIKRAIEEAIEVWLALQQERQQKKEGKKGA